MLVVSTLFNFHLTAFSTLTTTSILGILSVAAGEVFVVLCRYCHDARPFALVSIGGRRAATEMLETETKGDHISSTQPWSYWRLLTVVISIRRKGCFESTWHDLYQGGRRDP